MSYATTTCSYTHPYYGYAEYTTNGSGAITGIIADQTVTQGGNPFYQSSQAGSVSVGGPTFASSTCVQVSDASGGSGGTSCGTSTTSPCQINFNQIDFIGTWAIALATFAIFVWMIKSHR